MKVTRFTKCVVLVNCLVPVSLLGWDAAWGRLGANPANSAIHTTGLLSLIFLMLTLLITPASRITGWSRLTQFRRMMGLNTYFHACLHFLIFFAFDREGSLSSTLSEIVKRDYLMVGAVGLLLMVPLAATSTDGMIKRLGGRRWKALHRLVYVVAVAGVVHYYMLVKADVAQPVAFAVALGVLLGYRLVVGLTRLMSGSRIRGKAINAVAESKARPGMWSGPLTVDRVVVETPGVRTFRLVSAGSSRLPFSFLPGQYLNLSLMVDGRRIRRSYTIASSPSRLDSCELTIKREEHGIASRYLHDEVREGAVLDVSAPAGRFIFTGAEADSIVMIAGGVGITPLMAKIRYLTDIGWPGEIHLVFAVKTESDVIFRSELESLGARFPHLRVTISLTRDHGTNWAGERGRITPELLTRVVPRIADRQVHLCGPGEMNESTIQMLRDLGVPDERIKTESFGSVGLSGATPSVSGLEEPTPEVEASVTFSRSGKTKRVAVDETVLEASEDLGVDIAYDCRSGVCGRCRTKLLAGRVFMRTQAALSSLDRDEKMILSCQALCLDHVVVEA